MPIVRITEIPENRRDAYVDIELEVRSFRAATAVVVKDLRDSVCSKEYSGRVTNLWLHNVRQSGGFATRNGKHTDSWVMYEYIEGK